MKILKFFIIIVHIILGLIFIFLNVNSQIISYNKIHNTNSYYSSDDLKNQGIIDHIESLKSSEPQRITQGILGIIIGLFSIVGAVAFIKDKRWAAPALPMITSIMLFATFYITRNDTGFVANVSWLPVFILLIFLISEISYITLRKQTQSN